MVFAHAALRFSESFGSLKGTPEGEPPAGTTSHCSSVAGPPASYSSPPHSSTRRLNSPHPQLKLATHAELLDPAKPTTSLHSNGCLAEASVVRM